MKIWRTFTALTVIAAFLASMLTIVAFFEDRPHYAGVVTSVFSRTAVLAYWNLLFIALVTLIMILTYCGSWFPKISAVRRFSFSFTVATAPLGLLILLLILPDITYVNDIRSRFVLVMVILNGIFSLFVDQFLLAAYEKEHQDHELFVNLVDTLIHEPESADDVLGRLRQAMEEKRASDHIEEQKS